MTLASLTAVWHRPVQLIVSVLSLEAVVAVANPGRNIFFDWLSDILQYVLPAISNFNPALPNEHAARNFIAFTALLFPIKVWCLYLWLKQNPEEARKSVVVTPLSGRSILYSALILLVLVAMTVWGVSHFGSIGDVSWTDPAKVSPFGKVVYQWILRGGLPMWLGHSGFNMVGFAIPVAILLATARDWVLYIKNPKRRI